GDAFMTRLPSGSQPEPPQFRHGAAKKMPRFCHRTGPPVDLMDTGGGSTNQQDSSGPAAVARKDPTSSASGGLPRQQECEDEDDSLSIAEGEFFVIDEVNPQELDERTDSQTSDKPPVLVSADVTSEEALPSTPKILAEKVDTLAEATKEFFKSHPLDVMEMQLRRLIPSPSKRYIRMHCLTDNGDTHHQLPVSEGRRLQSAAQKSTVAKPAPSTSTPAASVAVPSVANLPAPAQQVPMPLRRQSNGSSQNLCSLRIPSSDETQRLPAQQLQPNPYQPHRYHSYQRQQISYSGFMDPYSSLYMQHREDRYQPYPCTYGSSRPCASNCQPAPSQGGSCTQQAPWIGGPLQPTPAPPSTQPQAYRRKLSSKKQSQPNGRGRPRPQPNDTEPQQPVQHDEAYGREQWLCSYCGIGFPDKSLYSHHRQYHDPQSVWRCSACGYQSFGVHDFNMHLVQLAHPLISALNCIDGGIIN
ncbi:hypothetical protein BOX15_Mlig005233g1, partial [Macrostomum lignano]